MKLVTKYSIEDEVYIKPIKIWGLIMSIFINSSLKTQYSVRYFDGLTAKDIYFNENELAAEEPQNGLGFGAK